MRTKKRPRRRPLPRATRVLGRALAVSSHPPARCRPPATPRMASWPCWRTRPWGPRPTRSCLRHAAPAAVAPQRKRSRWRFT
uniref:Putative secreted protein n=1 Tax=Ixodes ricinus TaxID=34613 RepID=A0A147BUI3_IXORI